MVSKSCGTYEFVILCEDSARPFLEHQSFQIFSLLQIVKKLIKDYKLKDFERIHNSTRDRFL